MADIVHPAGTRERDRAPAAVLVQHQEADWELPKLRYAPGGTWDAVTTRLHVASHPDLLRQRLDGSRAPLRAVVPSAAISVPGDHLAGAWEGSGRGRHVFVSPAFVAAAIEGDPGAATIHKRHFALHREPDATDAILARLLDCIALNLRDGDPRGSTFMQTVVLAIVHHALRTPATASRRRSSAR